MPTIRFNPTSGTQATILIVIIAVVVLIASWIWLANSVNTRVVKERRKVPNVGRHYAPDTDEPTRAITPLESIGGTGEIVKIVDQLFNRVMYDQQLRWGYADSETLTRIKWEYVRVFEYILGGTTDIDLSTMLASHRGRGITNGLYWRFIGHLCAALTDLRIKADVVKQLFSAMYDLRPLIVRDEAATDVLDTIGTLTKEP
jgi:truncated hemoglobin YjbI